MIKIREPNTVCRNPNCPNGENGEPKKFYACHSCLRNNRWRAYCCCIECYEEYTRLILESRQANKADKPLPLRTDMTEKQIKDVMNTPQRVIDAYTKEVELKDYFDDNPTGTIADAVEKINKDIDENKKKSRRKRTKTTSVD